MRVTKSVSTISPEVQSTIMMSLSGQVGTKYIWQITQRTDNNAVSLILSKETLLLYVTEYFVMVRFLGWYQALCQVTNWTDGSAISLILSKETLLLYVTECLSQSGFLGNTKLFVLTNYILERWQCNKPDLSQGNLTTMCDWMLGQSQVPWVIWSSLHWQVYSPTTYLVWGHQSLALA